MSEPIRFIDLFCGIGGFRFAMHAACRKHRRRSSCVFSSDIDEDAQNAYEANFGDRPHGDITRINAASIPEHDVLFGGFPCQAFSIIGDRRGFEDARGTLFFDIARILQAKRPAAFVLENVKQLRTHAGGKTLARILETLCGLGYSTEYRVLNALHFGVPQRRERIFIVGFREPRAFQWPSKGSLTLQLQDILEKERDVPDFYRASPAICKARASAMRGKPRPPIPSIWHENKGGNVSALPYSCALRAGASYNYLLVNGVRRPTERELLRLQGFPEEFKIVGGYSAVRKQAGNSVAVPCVQAVIEAVLHALRSKPVPNRARLFDESLFAVPRKGN